MKMINDGNWKQELAKLKAERIVHASQLRYFEGLHENQGNGRIVHTDHGVWQYLVGERVRYTEKQIECLDKAIETIENVFVNKQCYIDI